MKKDNQSKRIKELVKSRLNAKKALENAEVPVEELESLCGYFRGRARRCTGVLFESIDEDNDILF